MKPFIFILAICAFATNAHSQLDNSYGKRFGKSLKDRPAIKLNLNENVPINITPITPLELKQNMPVVKLNSNGTFLKNNGNGSDVFVYEPDNMPVIKPDATFKSNMPVAGVAPKEIKP